MKNDDICYLRLRLALYGSFMALYDLWRYLCSPVTSCVSLVGGQGLFNPNNLGVLLGVRKRGLSMR